MDAAFPALESFFLQEFIRSGISQAHLRTGNGLGKGTRIRGRLYEEIPTWTTIKDVRKDLKDTHSWVWVDRGLKLPALPQQRVSKPSSITFASQRAMCSVVENA